MLSSGLRIPLLLLLLLLLTAMELSWSFTEEDKKLIVDLHNQYRSKVSPPAADMLKMSWDPELETFAKDYATKCIWEHNKERGWRGENLFAMTGDLSVKSAVENWYNEYQHYNMTTLTCAEGEMCGHYTQVVWASSERVGCGTEFCKTLENLNDTDMHLVVCNYEPPGNVIGHKPYEEGSPCSKCPDGYSCEGSLCVSSVDLEGTTASPGPTGLEPTAILTTSPKSISITTGPTSSTAESPKPITEAEPESPTTKSPTSALEPTSDLDLKTSPELQTKATNASFPTGFTPHMDPTPASPGPTSTAAESPKPTTEAEPESPTTKSPTSALEPTSDLDLKTSPELQTKATDASLATGFTPHISLAPTPASPETGTTQIFYSELPSSDGLITSDTNMKNVEQPPTTTEPVPSTPKALPTPKLPPTPKKPPPSKVPFPHKPPSHPKPAYPKPVYPKPHSPPKLTPISKSPAKHRLSAYSKAIKRLNHDVQSSSGKAAHLSVCLPCLGCKQISQPEEIKTALNELTFRNPYTSCFSPLPRWRRHSKCRWCGRTWSHALTRASPYWLKSL